MWFAIYCILSWSGTGQVLHIFLMVALLPLGQSYWGILLSLQWRHDGRGDVSNHRRSDCLLNRLFGNDHRKDQSSASLAFVRKFTVTGEFLAQRDSYGIFFPFDDVIIVYTLGCHSGVSVRRASGQDSCSEEPGRLAVPQLRKWRAGSAARHYPHFVAGYSLREREFAYQSPRFN